MTAQIHHIYRRATLDGFSAIYDPHPLMPAPPDVEPVDDMDASRGVGFGVVLSMLVCFFVGFVTGLWIH